MQTFLTNLPLPDISVPGVVHLSLGGGNEAWLLHDGSYTARPVDDCAWNGAKDDVERALADAGARADVAPLQAMPLLVRWQEELILVDGGCGAAYGPGLGWASHRLAALGIAPEQISRVIFSHLHLDHVAGALTDDLKQLRYPNAKYAVGETEWKFWNQTQPDLSQTKVPEERKKAILQAIRPALQTLSAHVTFFATGDTIVPGLTAIDLVGHTPGQVGFVFQVPAQSDDQPEFELVYVADALVEPALHVPHPEWALIGDSLPALGEETRRRLLSRAVERNQLLVGYHFPLPGFGVIRKAADGAYRFVPSRWNFNAPFSTQA